MPNMATRDDSIYILLFTLTLITGAAGIYLVSDYYMDNGWPEAFGRVCGKTVKDDCAFINSHLNTFSIVDYGSNIDCTMTLDAGKWTGSRYKLRFKHFDIEPSQNCTSDYLEVFNGIGSYRTSIGYFCGSTAPDLDTSITGRKITLTFHTDGGNEDNGFKIMATRTLPYPCPSDYFDCKAENRCIDGRLKCDGISQCDDEADEQDCSFFEKLIGGFLALGVAGIVGVTSCIVFGCTGLCVGICMCTCCKKYCKCVRKCCGRGKVGTENSSEVKEMEQMSEQY